MMVGVTIGLFVVAAASFLMVSQLGENRRLLLETQVQQDLRAAADLVTRDLRRAGYTTASLNSIWTPGQTPLQSAWSGMNLSDTSAPQYRYERQSEQLYQFSLSNGTIFRRINTASAQPLTDRNTLVVTTFTVVEQLSDPPVAPVTLACASLCPDDSQDCWPRLGVRDRRITIEGSSANNASVVRRIQSRVRVRNDRVVFNAAGGAVCP